eukprot:TRINITY_DN4396_c0_g1_i1.p1 TRINITY_DN4396_c0_g1~~TRINITY_DN4396_c0_g1_i1.p1  ORF type:complete len:484 (-),score=112.49 TRINITY_DN4396_c0_g1_i1:105-1556(-)
MLNESYKKRLYPMQKSNSASNIETKKSKSNKINYSDRFISCRSTNNLMQDYEIKKIQDNINKRNTQTQTEDNQKSDNSQRSTYSLLLQVELCGSEIEMKKSKNENKTGIENKIFTQKNLLRYSSSPDIGLNKIDVSPYSLSPIGYTGQKLLSTPKTKPRKISKTPFKVLEAPSIQDDFYLNLVDWSSQDMLAVGLGSSVYIWNARTSQVTRVADLASGDSVASIAWNNRGNILGIGSSQGSVQTWQIGEGQSKKIREFKEHTARVGVLSWNEETLSSGSRDRNIFHRDVRSKEGIHTRLKGHSQEVCGLKWSHDSQFLASGGNDNKLLVWDQRSTSPFIRYSDHSAAVKAITWSPHQRGLLASGGGTADRCIKFRNVINKTTLRSFDTGSQVCNLAWSKNSNELVSTHGYSQNQVVVWDYPNLTPLATLTGHTMRVLYLAVSPNGETIVTGAGDETLRFWHVFPKKVQSTVNKNSILDTILLR